MRTRLTAGSVAAALLLGACVGYRPAPLDVDRPLRETLRPPDPATYEAAVRFAVEHNPDVLALRARAIAVNVDPPKESIEVGAGVDADHRRQADASLDVLSLLGLGTRNSERALACARRSEAWIAYHQRAREIAGEIAEAFLVETAIAGLEAPALDTDASAYVRAGLEGPVAEAAAKATRADWGAEQAARAAERRANRVALARLLGVRGEVVPSGLPPGGPPVEAPAPAVLIRARAEVQRKIAAFEVADRQVWRAVAGQYPAVLLEPGVAADPSALFGAVRLRIPVGAGREVQAADAAREAARQDVEGAILDALRDADAARAHLDAADAAFAAAKGRLDASVQLFRAEKTRMQVSGGSVIETVLFADSVVDAAKSARATAVEAARARVRAAVAAGWPTPPPAPAPEAERTRPRR